MLWYIVTAAMRAHDIECADARSVGSAACSARSVTRPGSGDRLDDVWQLVGDPARLYEWFPGITSSPVDGTSRLITTDAGLPMPEEILVVDPVQRRFQYRLTSPVIRHHRGTIDVIDLDDDDVRRRLLHRGRSAGDGTGDRRRHGRRARRTAAPDGDRSAGPPTTRMATLMGRKILLVTTDQQRFDTLGCNGGTVARTPVADSLAATGIPVRARPPAIGRVHAVAIDDHHRPAPEHPRRVDERRPAPRRRAVGRFRASPGRLSHGDHRQAALRAVPRPLRQVRRERVRPVGGVHDHAADRSTAPPDRTGGSSTSSRRPTPAAGHCTTRAWLAAHPSRGDRDVLSGARCRARGQRPRRRRHRRPAGARQPDPARVVPHRLGRRPHDRLARLARRRRRLVLLDELPRPAPPVGPSGVRARTRRLARVPLPAGYIADAATREAVLDAKPRHWRAWYDGRLVSNYEAPLRLGTRRG